MILDILQVTEYRPLTKVWISVVWFVLLLVGKLTLLVSKLLEDKLLQLGEFVFEYGSNLSLLLKEEPNHYKYTKHRDIHVQVEHYSSNPQQDYMDQLISFLQKDYLVELLLQQLVAFHHLLHLLQQAPHLKAKVVIK